MSKEDAIECRARWSSRCPRDVRVEMENGHKVLAHVSGKMRMHRIRILPATRSRWSCPLRLTRGRITYRFK